MNCLRSNRRQQSMTASELVNLLEKGLELGRSELHIWTFHGSVGELRGTLERVPCTELKMNDKDNEKRRTPLHYAATFWDEERGLEMVRLIINRARREPKEFLGSLVNARDLHQETPLHLAARFRKPSVVKLLLDSSADFTLTAMYTKTESGKDVPDSRRTGRPKYRIKSALELIYRYTPGVMDNLLDKGIKYSYKQDNKTRSASGIRKWDKSHIEMDFKAIIGKDINWSEPDTNSISKILKGSKTRNKEILLHPLVQLFLGEKVRKLNLVFWVSFAFHVIWSVICTLFLFFMYVYRCPYSGGQGVNRSAVWNNSDSLTEELADRTECDIIGPFWIQWGAVAVIAMSVLMAVKELAEFVTAPGSKVKYIKSLENVGQLLLIALITFSTLPIFLSYSHIGPWHYRFAAVAMFLPWGLVLGQVSKFHKFGIYIEIFIQVCKRCIKFTLAFGFIPIAFALSFAILLPQNPTFRSVPVLSAMVKVLVMMTGEFEYEEMFAEEKMGLPITTLVIFALFATVVTIALFNLLTGLIITDIQVMIKDAEQNELSSKLERIHLMEVFLINCNKVVTKLSRLNLQKWIAINPMLPVTLETKEVRKALRDEVRRLAYMNKPLEKNVVPK